MLEWFDLVPVVSFIALRGRCRRCRSAISPQYPVVELVTGIVFALVFVHQNPITSPWLLVTGYWFLVWSILIAISVYDLRHKIIPNGLVYFFIVLALLSALGGWNLPALRSFSEGGDIGNVTAGPLLALPLAILWLLSRGRAMGLGDAKLSLGIGWLLGLPQGIAALALSFWTGALVAVLMLALQRVGLCSRRRAVTMKSEIPFGPFLALGAFLAWFFEIDAAAIVGWF